MRTSARTNELLFWAGDTVVLPVSVEKDVAFVHLLLGDVDVFGIGEGLLDVYT